MISSGVDEGFSGKAKLTVRKAYGLRTPQGIEIALFHSMGYPYPSRNVPTDSAEEAKKQAGSLGVANAGETAGTRLEYHFSNSTFVCLQAQAVGDRVIATFAPPGTRF